MILAALLTVFKVFVSGPDCIEPEIRTHLERIAAADGNQILLTVSDPSEALAEVREDSWDALVVDKSAEGIVKRLSSRAGRARLYVHGDWAFTRTYYGDPSIDPEFARYGCDQDSMYIALTGRAEELCRKYGASVIPVGTAVQNVRTTFDRDNVTRDGVRLNYSIGCYLAACTWYEALSGRDVRDNSYDPGRLSPERLALARAAAHAAVLFPWGVSDFGFRKINKNYDEEKVPSYTLPDALTMLDGRRVETPEQWYAERRPELLSLFETEMFGKMPPRPEALHFKVVEEDIGVFAGTATRRQVNIYFTADEKHYMTLLLYLPNQVEGPVPVFLGANFKGNVTVNPDPGILYPDEDQIRNYQVYTRAERGSMSNRWPVGMILARGYGFATFCKNDLDPEFDDSFQNGVHGLFYKEGQNYPEPDEWGSISAWAWGYSRALDYLETDPRVDASKVAVTGHSRLSKTTLWAAVRDERFAMAFPNNPGCCGAAISRRCYGETLETIIRHYHYWFCGNFRKYAANESALPFDQHELLALMAPRPLYVGSGQYDSWSDPKGEFISLTEASKIYEFLGLQGLGTTENPGPWKPLSSGRIGYHMRSGPHEMTTWDWSCYLDFADKYLK